MAAKRLPRKITGQKTVATNSILCLPATAGANSGCMRGNDKYNQNGSASVGISEDKEPLQQSYHDFVHYNYGSLAQRQHNTSDE